MRLLAEMEVDEELVDEDIEIVHRLSGVDGIYRQTESGDDEGESFESINSGSDSDIYEADPVLDVSDHLSCQ